MSNRYSHSNDRNKGFAKPQRRFVPKSVNSSNSIPAGESEQFNHNPKLSSSLRQSFSNQSDSLSVSDSTGVLAPVKNGGVQKGNFVLYLPQDEAVAAGLGPDCGGLDTVESQGIVDHLNKELSRLLKLNPRDFWGEVASDSSFHNFLDSYLKFRSRWYDFPYRGANGIVAGVIVGEFELSRRVFMVLYRISSHRDPGTKAADSLSPKDHAVLLQKKKLLDLPKLFDICAIYGHDNENLTQSLVANAIKAQPWIQDEFTAVITHFLDIVHTMYQRCTASLEVLLSSHGKEDSGSSHLSSDYLEVMDFLNDSIVSMDAFISAYNPAAVIFSCPIELSYGNEDLLNTLTKLHEVLLPSLQKGFKVLSAREDVQEKHDAVLSLKMLSKRMVDLAWKLLSNCYLSGEVFDGCYNLPAITKMYPANVEDPIIRSDILVQTLREIGEGYPNVEEGQRRGTLLQNIERHYKITERIQELQSAGWIVMDDGQFRYISGLVNHPFSEANMKSISNPAPTPTSSNPQIDEEDTAIIESKISQIKDLFPDYGKGFLSACLEVYNQNPEEVIQRILDGTLHKDLQLLDTSLDKIQPPPPKSAPINRKDKGKGILMEPSDAYTTSKSSHTNGPSISSGSSAGRFVRKGFNSETFNTRDVRDLTKTAALASQLEYDDEYDDSFDDLGLGIVDSGFEEPEALPIQGKASQNESSDSRWTSRKTPQFYVKDGKNYSYKVSGSIAVSNQNEAALVNQAQKELIHGLGQGGNLPLGAVKKLSEANEERPDNDVSEVSDAGGRGSFRGRGGRGGRNHYRRDRAMKKHMSSVSGH